MTSDDETGRVKPPSGFNWVVLRSVQFLGVDASGVAIRHHLEKATGREVLAAAVYVALSRLERRGLISCHAELVSAVKRRGRPRNIYRIEAPGLRALEAGIRLYNPVASESGATAQWVDQLIDHRNG